MRYPIRYEWWLDSHALIGEATVNIGGTIVSYDVRGNRCELVLDEGESLTAELLVRATASDDLDLLADKYIEVKGSTEIRSFHGVELLEGPQVLELLQTMEFPTPIEETTSMMYLDEVRIVARRLESEWRSRRSLFAEQRSALLQGMGFDFQIEDFR